MVRRPRQIGFETSISARDDGTLEALYIVLEHGKVSRTEELEADILLADYDREGRLLGIEVLAPVALAQLTALVDVQRRESFRKFIEKQAPQELVHA